MTTATKQTAAAADIVALLRARNPLIWVITREEARVERYLIEAAAAASYTPRLWDVVQGVTTPAGVPDYNFQNLNDPGEVLRVINARVTSGNGDRSVWILRDLPVWLTPPTGSVQLRQLRNLARVLPGTPRDNAQAIIILTPAAEVPADLAGHATVIEWPLPDRPEIASILDAAISALPDDLKETAAPNDVRDAAIDAAVGLSGEEAAACYARSLVQLRKIDPATVAREKKRVITRERVLEWYDPLEGGLDAVGGLANLKEWLKQRKLAYSAKARAYGLPAPKGTLLVGIPGCLTGDTIVNICRKQRPGGHKSIRLDALFYRFNNRHAEGADLGLYDKSKQWDLSIPTQTHCYNEKQRYIGFNKIVGVYESGLKEVYRLTTDHGTHIKATADHKFLTPNGYVKLQDLRVEDALFSHQIGTLTDDNSTGRNKNKALRQITNVGNHPHARRRVVNDLEYSSHPLHRLVVEADLNGLRFEQYLWALQGDTTGLKFLNQDQEVHHRDRDRDNNTLSNLQVLTKAEHARLHMKEDGQINRFRYAPRLQKVASIERLGVMPTYDIEVEAPNHNFIANGLVVHNCGKSLTAKAIATAWGVPLLRVDLGALKSKFVGESEANLRKAFRVIESIGRCVVWFDEIEKALAGATQGAADGGVSSDALGGILSWMQERQGEAFVIATANDVSQLPPEILRQGRFESLWFLDLPTRSERIGILKAALTAHNRAVVPIDHNQVADVCDTFTGAEIAALVPEALFAAFADGGREIETNDLVEVAKSIVPIAKTSAEKIVKLREWASQGRARRASPEEDVAPLATSRALDL